MLAAEVHLAIGKVCDHLRQRGLLGIRIGLSHLAGGDRSVKLGGNFLDDGVDNSVERNALGFGDLGHGCTARDLLDEFITGDSQRLCCGIDNTHALTHVEPAGSTKATVSSAAVSSAAVTLRAGWTARRPCILESLCDSISLRLCDGAVLDQFGEGVRNEIAFRGRWCSCCNGGGRGGGRAGGLSASESG